MANYGCKPTFYQKRT